MKTIVTCEIGITLSCMGGKWKPFILYYLAEESPKRFGEIKQYISVIPQKTLANQLRELECDALISRQVFAEVPPRVEYSITEKGMSLFPILDRMCTWGHENGSDKYDVLRPHCWEA